jgi:hypothetical protein
MKAAYEGIGHGILVWACAPTAREARRLASQRITECGGEKIPANYFKVCEAKSGWSEKCGPGVEDWTADLDTL